MLYSDLLHVLGPIYEYNKNRLTLHVSTNSTHKRLANNPLCISRTVSTPWLDYQPYLDPIADQKENKPCPCTVVHPVRTRQGVIHSLRSTATLEKSTAPPRPYRGLPELIDSLIIIITSVCTHNNMHTYTCLPTVPHVSTHSTHK